MPAPERGQKERRNRIFRLDPAGGVEQATLRPRNRAPLPDGVSAAGPARSTSHPNHATKARFCHLFSRTPARLGLTARAIFASRRTPVRTRVFGRCIARVFQRLCVQHRPDSVPQIAGFLGPVPRVQYARIGRLSKLALAGYRFLFAFYSEWSHDFCRNAVDQCPRDSGQ